MLAGTLIGESVRRGAHLSWPGVRLRKIYRLDLGESAGAGQPPVWTCIEFEADDEDADGLAQAIAAVLETGGWYCDFGVGTDHVVIWADRIFRYRNGDVAARAEVEAYGRRVGVPEHQLDWPE